MTVGGGLFLLVTTAGGGYGASCDGKEKLLSIGEYPDISRVDARKACDPKKKLLSEGLETSIDHAGGG